MNGKIPKVEFWIAVKGNSFKGDVKLYMYITIYIQSLWQYAILGVGCDVLKKIKMFKNATISCVASLFMREIKPLNDIGYNIDQSVFLRIIVQLTSNSMSGKNSKIQI